MSDASFRKGTLVDPLRRIDAERRDMIHNASISILSEPGFLCFNEQAADIFGANGCTVTREDAEGAWNVRIPREVVMNAVESAPSRIVLGARDRSKALELDSTVPREYFGTGSETNIFLETSIEKFRAVSDSSKEIEAPVFTEHRGSISRLCDSARLCNALENVDFFIRNVNIQDEGIGEDNKDVNVFFASLMYMTKHVQAGITNLDALDDVLRMAEIIAGGPEALKENPLVSFIACVVKSPLQMVNDTTNKVIEIAKRGVPLVISSSPQGGSTAPVQEEGIVSMINAEILAGITLTQLVNPGTPVLYGAVPVRARLDTLHDLYGIADFVHYNLDCVQMARQYRIPCYSTAGVGDAKTPGVQATLEKMLTHMGVGMSGAQYIHYAFGLLDRTNVFSPVQAVLDDSAVGMVRNVARKPKFDADDVQGAVNEVGKVMKSGTRLFARHIRKHLRRGVVSDPFPYAGDGVHDETIARAVDRLAEIRGTPGEPLPKEIIEKIREAVPGLLSIDNFRL